VFKGQLGGNLWRFTRDVVAYALRVEAYALLIHDHFPSFSLAVDVESPRSRGSHDRRELSSLESMLAGDHHRLDRRFERS
jgi:hypothetical protein